MFRTILCISTTIAWVAIISIKGQSINFGLGVKTENGMDPGRLPKLEQIGEIHPALPKTRMLDATESYFEVDDDADFGDEVVGRVNLANNSFEEVDFFITGGSGDGLYSIEKFVNSRGKHFGVFKVGSDKLVDDTYTLQVEARFSDGTTDLQEYTIHQVEELLAEKFLNLKGIEFSQHRRLSRSTTDVEVRRILSQLTSDGNFTNLPYGMSKVGWENTCVSAERLLKLASAFLHPDSNYFNDERLKDKLYEGILRNSEQNARFRSNWFETHVWRNSDFIAGIGIRFCHLLRAEMKSDDPFDSRRAIEVYDAILDVCDVMWAERMYERPAIGNANRNHRMRSLITRAAISYDYNRALTDEDVWYDQVDPRIPGYYPNGALGDVMELIETGFVFMDSYNNRNGFFPDGTICHHPRVGLQFTADAYGWEWLVENSIPMANFLKDTRYKATNGMYNTIADRILDSYRPLTFNGYLDMSVGGLLPDRSKWGPDLLKAVTGLIEGKSKDTIIAREDELREFMGILKNNQFVDELTLNQPFWNIDYLVHRRPDYIASAKMISTRSRGLERGVDRRSYYYLGDGALFIRVNDSDYNGLSDVYNWHAIPGVTAEQRLDALPLAADSPFRGANGTNTFAGVASDGFYGFGAFKYERNHPDDSVNYSTVNANKGYFFFEDEIIALGNNIRRVRKGDQKEVWTILNQIAWKSDILYSVNGVEKKTISFGSGDQQLRISANTNAAYFYQDRVGYVIIPGKEEVAISLSAESRGNGKQIFQLAINHGDNPKNEAYQYLVLPNISPRELEAYVGRLNTDPPVQILKNDNAIIAVQNNRLKMAQVAFYEAGSIWIHSGLKNEMNLSVDRPALVIIREFETGLTLTVTDPHHSTSETKINVTLNRKLSGPNCTYDFDEGVSRISFTHSDVEVYAGKPISVSYKMNSN
jgi:hypothetical protein